MSRKTLSPFTNRFKTTLALLLVLLTVLGVSPLNVFAQTATASEENEEVISIQFMGETVEAVPTESGVLRMDVDLLGNTEFVMTEYIWFDGRRISISDERIGNVVPVVTPLGTFADNPRARTGALPPVNRVIDVDARFYREPVINMNSRRVSARRYAVEIDGITYEAFCADPNLPGPESNASVYEITGEAPRALFYALRYGFPVNPYLSDPSMDNEDLMWWAYVTRVAVAMAANPNGNFTGDATALQQARQLADGQTTRDFDNTSPAITVNGVRHADDLGREIDAAETLAASLPFQTGFNRRHHQHTNPFRFEWAPGTPAGTRLLVNGNVVATAAQDITARTLASPTIFRETVSFTLEMPNEDAFVGATAKVYMIGVHNQYAGRIWMMQNPQDRDNWQDIVFYIPYIRSSAAFSFNVDEIPYGGLRIIKTSQANGNRLSGAVFEVRDSEGALVRGNLRTNANGEVMVTGLEPGVYTITEVTPPSGYTLAEPVSQQVTVVADETATATVTFSNPRTTTPPPVEPPTVRIQKICAISRENIPGALMRLRGMSAHTIVTGDGEGDQYWILNNTGINVSQVLTAGATTAVPGDVISTVENGVWTLEGLPWGFFMVEEERAPEGYSLYPQHTAFGFWLLPPTVTVEGIGRPITCPVSGEVLEIITVYEITESGGVSHILITFENYPFSEIVVYKREMSNGIGNNQLLAGATFRIQGYYPGNPAIPIDRTATTGANGRVVFSDLPAGHFTITEIQPPTGYLLGDNNVWTVNIGWGQTVAAGTANSHTFFNIPKSFLEILKIDAITNEPLAGAIFELYDPTTGERWQATTGANGIAVFGRGSNGNFLYPYRTYIVREITAPEGYFLMKGPREIVLSPGDENRITFENYPFSEIVIYKREVSNGIGNNQLLAGATFRIQGYYPGYPSIPIDRVATTGADGRVVFDNLPAGHFTITEIQPPTGFLLGENNVWAVNINWGQTVAAGTASSHTFFNVPKSSLEILKVCGVSNEPLAGAIFELYDPTSGERWQATSGANGIAVFGRGSNGNFLYPYRTYIIREIVAPDGFVLMDGPREIVLSPGDENRITWRNWRNPGLTIVKLCQDTGERLAGAHFTIEAQGSGRPLPTDFPMITDENGEIFIPWTLFEGEVERNFIVTETVPPPGFHLSDPNWQLVTLQAGYDNTVVFRNRRMPTLTIEKTDSITGAFIQGAEFTIERLSPAPTGMLTGNPFRTNAQGRIVLPDLPAGVYRIIETRAANNYWLDPHVSNRTWTITIRENEDYLLQVQNTLLPSLIITKMNAVTHRPVPLTHFRIYYEVPNSPNVELIGNFVTDSNGQIILPFVQVGWYRFIETRPAPGMSLATNNSFRVFLSPGQNTYQLMRQGLLPSNADIPVVTDDFTPPVIPEQYEELPPSNVEPPDIDVNDIEIVHDAQLVAQVTQGLVVTGGGDWLMGEGVWNFPLNSIVIKKTCSVARQLLGGATFEVIHTSAGVSGTLGTVIGRYTTDPSGIIVLTGLVPGSYVVREVTPPRNFTLSETNTQTVFLQPDGHSVVEIVFANDPYGSLLIVKRCEVTGTPLRDAEFEVRNSNGTVVGTANGRFTTNMQGEILIPNLPPDSYVVTEIRAPEGFVLNSAPQTIRVEATGQTYRLEFTNRPLSSLVIRKLDDFDGGPLAGAIFEVRRQNGEWVGEFETGPDGTITIPGLLGWFIVTETQAPAGFALDPNATRTVEVRPGAPTVVTFRNPRLGSIVIEKVDGNGAPLAGAQFRVTHQNGELVGNFTSSGTGMVSIPNLPAGWFNIEETRAPQGFVIAQGSQTVEVRPNAVAHVTFVNYEMPTLIIEKVDENGRALAGAVFEIRRPNGELLSRVTTNAQGIGHVGALEPGTVVIEETRAPDGFMILEASRIVELRPGENRTERFVNARMSNVTIRKISGDDGRPLAGVVFEVTSMNGERVQNPANNSFEFVTDSAGMIILPQLQPGTYVARETRALPGYQLADPYTFIVTTDRDTTITIRNYRMPNVTIRKICGDTNRPLQGVVFEIARYSGVNAGERLRNPVNGSFEFVTDAAGLIQLAALEHGTFVAIETRPLPGYAPAEPTVFVVGGSENTTITIRNYKMPSVVIRKICGDTGQPLAGVQFEIARYFGNGNTGQRLKNYAVDSSYIFTTDRSGHIYLPTMEDGVWIAIETRPLPGFMAGSPTIFTVGNNGDTTIIVRNYRYPDFAILKLDGATRRPLQGVHFEIAHYLGQGRAGERLINPADRTNTFVTDAAGRIPLPSLAPGMYIAIETRALPGYVIEGPTIFTVAPGADRVITIYNHKRADWVIRKTDGDTGQPLPGVHFEIARYFGNGNAGERLQNPVDGSTTFITDNAGLIHLPNLEPGTYVAIETRALPGFILAEPVIFVVREGAQNTTIDIRNYRGAELTIRKINSITRAPLEGVVFEISRPDGTRLVNPQTGFHEFVTDSRGLIHLPTIPDGRYYLHETRALPGFLVDQAVIPFNIDSSARQREHVLTVENTPASGLLIIKTDAQTGRPLAGVEFEIRHADGRLVTGQILDGNQPNTPANSPQMAANGNFLTDSRGRIELNHLAPGVYHVTETRALPGYQLDTTVHVVTVLPGQQAVLEVENAPLAGFRLLKVCAFTGQGIFNVEFMVFDHNGKVVGVFYTDNNGVIDFSAILAPGRYTIRETRPAPGFSRDDIPRTVEFVAGRVTEIVWENVPIAGQLQILKVSGDNNIHNGLPAGTPLQGAIFEIFDARTGNLVDRIISNERGMAVSRPLPLGRYIAREVAAPAFYMINPQEIYFIIEHENQIVRVTFPNFSANTGVTIRKTGPAEAMQGHNIFYEIPIVRNDSSIPLADFFWRDVLPTNAVRADRLITGTYNHNLRYRVIAMTNRGNEIVVADNLSTLVNNVVELRPVHLGLAANEYITEIILFFGQVPAGFSSVERPRIFVDVLSANQAFLPDGMMFANKVDVGGRIPGTDEWVIGNSTTATTIFNPRRIPQSGW